MAVTLAQVYALLTAVNSKIDALITEEGILMSQTSDIQAAADLITAEVAQLNDSYTQLSGLVGQLRAQGVDPAVLDQFDQALSTLKPSVDRIASIAPQPASSPASSPADPTAAQQAQQQGGQQVPSQTAAAGQPGDSPGTAAAAAQDQDAAAQDQDAAAQQQGGQQQPQDPATAAGMNQPPPEQRT